MATRIAVRRDTGAHWATANPVLVAGEPALDTDTGKVKYGDGVLPYNDLPYTGDAQVAAALATANDYTDAQISPFGKISVPILSTLSMSDIQALINANPGGTRFEFTPGTIALAGALTLPYDNVVIDAPYTTFTQSVWQQPAFDAISRNGCEFNIGLVQFIGIRGGQGSSSRGSAGYVSGAGVWINGDNNYVRRLKTLNMAVGVFLSSWNGTSANDRVGVGNHLGQVETTGANFSLLYVAQDGLAIDDIYGHDDIDDSAGANPTHVIYGSAITSFRATGGEFKSIRAKNILTGQPVQVKFHDGLSIGSIVATNCKGLLNVIDSNDLTVNSYLSLGTLANAGQGAITFQRSVTNSQRPRLGGGRIQLASGVDERAFNLIADNSIIDSLAVESNHSGSVSTSIAEIMVRGTGNVLRKTTVRSLGAGSIPAIMAGFPGETANNTLVDGLVVTGSLSGVLVVGGSTGVVVNYDAAAQTITGPTFIDLTGGQVAQTTTAPPAALSTLGESALLALLANATPTVGAANLALQVRVTPRRTITVSSLSWWSVSPSGNYDIAIVDDTTSAVLWSKGSTAWPAAGKIVETVTGSVKMLAGRTYRLVFSADNATGTFRGNQAAVAGLDLRLDGSTVTTAVSAAFPIPTPTLAAGSTGSSTRTPLIVVGGS